MSYLRFLQNSRLMNEAGQGEGGAPASTVTPSSISSTSAQSHTPAAPASPAPITQEAMQAAIKTAVDTALLANNAKRDEAEIGLKKNKEVLLTEKKALEKRLKDNADAIRMKAGDVGEVTREIEARVKGEYSEKLSDAEKQIEIFKTEKHNNTIEAFVDGIVDSCNIKPAFRNARKLEILHGNKIDTDESGNITIDGRNQQEFVKDWLENGQNVNDYVLAPTSNGGGANGAKGNAGATGHAETLSTLQGAALMAAASKMVHEK